MYTVHCDIFATNFSKTSLFIDQCLLFSGRLVFRNYLILNNKYNGQTPWLNPLRQVFAQSPYRL